jgi:hypothetical protein
MFNALAAQWFRSAAGNLSAAFENRLIGGCIQMRFGRAS